MIIKILSRFTLVISLMLLFFTSCTDDEPLSVTNDKITPENIETLLDNGFEMYESLLSSRTKEDAKEATLNDLLKSEYVVSGEEVKQGVFLVFSDGSKAAILTDGDDAAEHDTIPETPVDFAAIQDHSIVHKSLPLQTKTILLNPHYYERKRYTNWLVSKYNSYFPLAGFKMPEVYVNQDCTLDKFASLDEYGIVHIYSYGIKSSDGTVYLLTGEKINAATNLKYKDDILADNIMKIRAKMLGTVYMIRPEFVQNQNDFSEKKPLVYGGFCHSYEGNWPQLCNIYHTEKSIAGYFGFDNSVYTTKNVEWANDLFLNLTNADHFEPREAFYWRANTTLGSSYLNRDGKTVTIRYIGDRDLKLWQWENTLWGYKYYKFTIRVNALVQQEDGTFIRKNDFLLHECTGKGAFTNHRFIGKGYRYRNDGKVSIGSIDFTLDPVNLMISDFTISDTTSCVFMDIDEKNEMQCKLSELPYASTTDPYIDGALFSLKDEAIIEKTDTIYAYYFLKKDSIISTGFPIETIEVIQSYKLLDFTVNGNSAITLELSTSPQP